MCNKSSFIAISRVLLEDKAINKISVLIFRVMLSLIFLVAAINHLFEPGKAVHRLAESKMRFLVTSFISPEVLVMLSGIGLLVGGLSLMNYKISKIN